MPSARIEHLEERLAWLERHVTDQDKAMLALHEELSLLRSELKPLHERLAEELKDSESPEPEERPPHY
ncbi:MAG: SlyX family protein [Opitutaceae bacterium]|jgi:SlyX protein